jgi:hypothetical protein
LTFPIGAQGMPSTEFEYPFSDHRFGQSTRWLILETAS